MAQRYLKESKKYTFSSIMGTRLYGSLIIDDKSWVNVYYLACLLGRVLRNMALFLIGIGFCLVDCQLVSNFENKNKDFDGYNDNR